MSYSDFAKAVIIKTPAGMYVFPNPVSGNHIGLQMNSMPAGVYTIKLINNLGQEINTTSINHAGGTANHSITIHSSLPSGTYQATITGPEKKLLHLKVLVQQ